MKKIESTDSLYRPIRVGDFVYGNKSDLKRENFDKLIELFDDKEYIDKTTLDLGAGAGGLSFALINKGIKSAVSVEHGERSNRGKNIAERHNITNIDFRKESIDEFLSLNKDYYDFIFLLNILHWLDNPKEVLNQLHKCCNKYIIIETPATVVKIHTNNYTTDTYLNYFKGYDIRKYPRPNSCDGPRDGLIIDIGKHKSDKVLNKRSNSGSGGIVYKSVEENIIVYEGIDKKKHLHPIKCRFKEISSIPISNLINNGKWYMGTRSDSLINKYAEDMNKGDIFPPILVYKKGNRYYVIDGSHRHEARKKYFKTINAIVLEVL